MADRLVKLGVDIVFVIGGDGSMRGATRLADVLLERSLPIAVIGIPKTIGAGIDGAARRDALTRPPRRRGGAATPERLWITSG